MNNNAVLKYLFVVNPVSGNNNTNFRAEIEEYFTSLPGDPRFFELPASGAPQKLKEKINQEKPDKLIAVGGDGTVKLVAEAVWQTNIPIGILPAGSANGMAKELGISTELKTALDIIFNGRIKKIHAIKINNELCIHLSDIGFNAFVIKKFESEKTRGMWGYVKAAWKVLWSHSKMQVLIQTDEEEIRRQAAMVVIANATQYGTGVLINPEGKLTDDLFEVVIVRKISLSEIFKMRVTHMPYDPSKTEIIQTRDLNIQSRHRVHFQVDGEYLGKINEIKATILPNALNVIVPV
jgi:YegS/Rv2252/BmrU family lipid kinase